MDGHSTFQVMSSMHHGEMSNRPPDLQTAMSWLLGIGHRRSTVSIDHIGSNLEGTGNNVMRGEDDEPAKQNEMNGDLKPTPMEMPEPGSQ
jgi:hypothetical protein